MSETGKIIRGAGAYLKRNTQLGVGMGPPHGGDEGDIRVHMVDSSPKLYAKAGGQWYGINLEPSNAAGGVSEELILGGSADHIKITPESGLEVINNYTNVAKLGRTLRIGRDSTTESAFRVASDGAISIGTSAVTNFAVTAGGVITLGDSGAGATWDGVDLDGDNIANDSITDALLGFSAQSWTTDLEIRGTAWDAVIWDKGTDANATMTFADGTTKTLTKGTSTGLTANKTYFVYASSGDTTVRLTVTYTVAVGNDKILLGHVVTGADASEGGSPSIFPFRTNSLTISASAIAADAITANTVAANAINSDAIAITGHRGLLEFAAGDPDEDESSSNICIGNSNYRPMNDLDDEATNDDNIAIGDYCLSEAQNATDNVVIGNGCMRYFGKDDGSTTAALCGGNIAIGVNALQGLDADTYTRGWDNVAIGMEAMKLSARYEVSSPVTDDVTECKENIAIGKYAGYRISGAKNTFIGMNAGYGANTSTGAGATGSTFGYGNVAIGFDCFTGYTVGSYNLVAGFNSGDSIISGNYNIVLGYQADVTVSSTQSIAIGKLVVTDAHEQLRIGDDSHYLIYDFSSGGAEAITSDVRIKKDIVDTDIGLDFVNALRPVKYTPKEKYEWPDELYHDGVNKNKEGDHEIIGNKRMDGFIAQDVKQVMDDLDITFSGWHENKSSRQMLGYSVFVVPLVKAVQELSAKVTALEAQIN